MAALLLMAVLGVLAGCGSQEEKQEEPRQEEEEDRIRIGLSFDTFVLERWQRDRDAFVARASELGAEVNVQNANGDVEEQIAQIEYLIEKDVDVIAVIAVDSRGLSDVVAKAKRAGIRVIAYDRLLTDAGVDLYISFDNERIGQMMAECIAANTPAGGKVFMMCGSPEDNNVSLVEKGFYSVMDKTDLEIVGTAYADNWLGEMGYAAVSGFLQRRYRQPGDPGPFGAAAGRRGLCGGPGRGSLRLSADRGGDPDHDRLQIHRDPRHAGGGECRGPGGGGKRQDGRHLF